MLILYTGTLYSEQEGTINPTDKCGQTNLQKGHTYEWHTQTYEETTHPRRKNGIQNLVLVRMMKQIP